MRKVLVCSILFILGVVATLPAWWVKGHGTIAEAAVSRLPNDVPAFFRAGGKHLAHLAGDPDRWKNREATFLRAAEYADHFLDLEDLQGNELPRNRYEANRMIVKLNKLPERVGMLPYAILEHYDRLSCAFKDYRDDPKNETVHMKCLIYAGVLSHYTGDCSMPLHTTRDYDGRMDAQTGKMTQKGIHAKIDGFPEKFGLTAEEIGRGLEPKVIDDMWKHTMQMIQESHKHIERCYELDKQGAFEKPTKESREFILERCRVGAQFTMDVWHNAWLRSAKFPKPY